MKNWWLAVFGNTRASRRSFGMCASNVCKTGSRAVGGISSFMPIYKRCKVSATLQRLSCKACFLRQMTRTGLTSRMWLRPPIISHNPGRNCRRTNGISAPVSALTAPLFHCCHLNEPTGLKRAKSQNGLQSRAQEIFAAFDEVRQANPDVSEVTLIEQGKLQPFPGIPPSLFWESGREFTVVAINWGTFTNDEIVNYFRQWLKEIARRKNTFAIIAATSRATGGRTSRAWQ